MSLEQPPKPEHPLEAVPRPGPVRASSCLLTLILIAVLAGGGIWFARHNRPAGTAGGPQGGSGRGGPGGSGGGEGRPVPVLVAKVIAMNLPIEITGIGTVQAYSTVPITSQVTGQLLSVSFKQGDFVRQGQTLFTVDPRTLQASVDQAQAVVARDQAQVAQAEAVVTKDQAAIRQAQSNLEKDLAQQRFAQQEAQRYSTLVHQGFVTVEQAEQQTSTARSFEGTISADRAAINVAQATSRADQSTVNSLRETMAADMALVRNAQVQLGFATITAPVSGRTGSLNQYPGALVRAGDTTPIVTIDQIQPIYVSFAVPEQYLADIRRFQAESALRVTATSENGQAPDTGRVTFIDNAVDPTTGTITLRATFANPARRLWPGRYCTVTLKLSEERNALVVPQQAVQPGQNGNYVFVVQPDMTVQSQNVKVERQVGTWSVIASGLRAGETVVTDGQLQLTPGARVEISQGRSRGAAAPGGGTPAGAARGGWSGRHRRGGGEASGQAPSGTPLPARGEPQAAPASPSSVGPLPATSPGSAASAAPGAAPQPTSTGSGRHHRHRPGP